MALVGRILATPILLILVPAGAITDPNCSFSDDNALIQYRSRPNAIGDGVASAWVAGPFGDCMRACPEQKRFSGPDPAYQKRAVRCMSLDDQPLSEGHCAQLVKPKRFRRAMWIVCTRRDILGLTTYITVYIEREAKRMHCLSSGP
ncbi:unnamed protein product [Durusdinium trenchii]|uniref:Uncharacterized protein n=1 Tax=Durusdinium trenchii TaxID=1381693 RepID=A0ABP0PDT2_9DINO